MATSLRSFTTMKIGGSAELILRLSDLSEISKPLPHPIRILGNGSNTLIDDRGLKGSVIIVRDFGEKEPKIISEDSATATVEVSAGIFLPTLSRWAAKRGLSGCEYMVGVPGTLGGAIVQNAGANDQEIAHILISAQVFDLEIQKLSELPAKNLQLTYRHSDLKELPQMLVTSARLQLKKASADTIEEQTEKNLAYRKQKTPYAKPSLGSIFTRIRSDDGWIFAGKLIEDAGLKNLRIGGAMVSPVHANYIVNEDQATFVDVIHLIEEVERRVFEHSGHKLEREILVWSDLPTTE